MKLNDILVGAFFMALATLVLAYARPLPPMPGQRYGAAAFPTVIAVGLFGFSLVLAWRAWVTRSGPRAWVELAAWARDRRMLANFALALVLIGVYVLASDAI